ncbi:Protein kinase-like domain [Pseudocohnilembus persalinus]|uniref:Protein kinase-like domain n=1 Tax=Pseudocohnilembus persalinus TaxID=266149 RepID=A0A0V0QSS8_PSEPJ|nr:Protein kinase-like domain [Pseudocohnilembus persalinus]|eukprot:KRX04984.1 Protein kinase-like domain [Pseudocohnilembus persalinus]
MFCFASKKKQKKYVEKNSFPISSTKQIKKKDIDNCDYNGFFAVKLNNQFNKSFVILKKDNLEDESQNTELKSNILGKKLKQSELTVGEDLLSKLLEVEPKKRISCQQALQHPFFKKIITQNCENNTKLLSDYQFSLQNPNYNNNVYSPSPKVPFQRKMLNSRQMTDKSNKTKASSNMLNGQNNQSNTHNNSLLTPNVQNENISKENFDIHHIFADNSKGSSFTGDKFQNINEKQQYSNRKISQNINDQKNMCDIINEEPFLITDSPKQPYQKSYKRNINHVQESNQIEYSNFTFGDGIKKSLNISASNKNIFSEDNQQLNSQNIQNSIFLSFPTQRKIQNSVENKICSSEEKTGSFYLNSKLSQDILANFNNSNNSKNAENFQMINNYNSNEISNNKNQNNLLTPNQKKNINNYKNISNSSFFNPINSNLAQKFTSQHIEKSSNLQVNTQNQNQTRLIQKDMEQNIQQQHQKSSDEYDIDEKVGEISLKVSNYSKLENSIFQ